MVGFLILGSHFMAVGMGFGKGGGEGGEEIRALTSVVHNRKKMQNVHNLA